MKGLRLALWLVATVIGVGGCATPMAIPESAPVASVTAVTGTQTPPVITPQCQKIEPLSTDTVTDTATPATTSLPMPEFIPTPTPLPELLWSDGVVPVGVVWDVDTFTAVWSPVAHEFVVGNCWAFWNGNAEREAIFRVSVPNLGMTDVAPAEFECELLFNMTWTPDGQQIVFFGPFPEDHPNHPSNYGFDNSALLIMDRDGANSHPVNYETAYGRYPEFTGWMDEGLLVYKGYAGGGHHVVYVLDIGEGEAVSWALVHLGGGYRPSKDYVATNTGMLSDFHITAVAVSQTPLQEDTEFDGGPFLFCVSRFCHGNPPDRPPLLEENSRFEDWLPGTNLMLIVTWDRESRLRSEIGGINLRINPTVTTQFQLWDVDSHSVTPFDVQGISGRFSPDARYLAYHTLSPSPHLHVLELETGETIFSHSSAEPHFELNGQVFLWSPDGQQLVLRAPDDNWGIVSLTDRSFSPLTINGGGRLSDPQWSYDGRYLSFSTQGDGVTILAIGESR
jgi:hypothetical protein